MESVEAFWVRSAKKLGLRIAVAFLGLFSLLSANAEQSFRIATGGEGAPTMVGELLAKTLSRPGIIELTSQRFEGQDGGAVRNLTALRKGEVESIVGASHMATWAYHSLYMFSNRPKQLDLRLIANLSLEGIQIVVRKDSGISTVADLKGKRVSLDRLRSGRQTAALLILRAHGVSEHDVQAEYLALDDAADKLEDGELDAFFFVGPAPSRALTELARRVGGISLLPIQGLVAASLLQELPYLVEFNVKPSTYLGVGAAVPTLAIAAQWLTSDRVSHQQIYELTKALFSESNQKQIRAIHPQALPVGVGGSGVPLHPGAERFYREAGFVK